MSTKEYLKSAYILNNAIDSKIERVTRLRKIAEAIGYYRPELRAEILRMERTLDQDIDRLIRQQSIIEREIRAIPDERARMLLELRYLNHLSWEAIGQRMYVDTRWAQRLHNRAVALLHIPEAELKSSNLDVEEGEIL